MKNFIENHQFYYVNDKFDLSKLNGIIDAPAMMYIEDRLNEISLDSKSSISFLKESMDNIDDSIEKWYTSYIEKIESIKNTNLFISMMNLTPDDLGYYTIAEIDHDQTSGVIFSKSDNGYIMTYDSL